MSSTNKTTNYELSQFIGSDKPAWLQDYNTDMTKIDSGIHTAQTTATGADGKADANATNIGAMNTLTTTDKTSLVGAVNEVNANAITAQNTATASAGVANGAKTEADAIARYLSLTQTGSITPTVTNGTIGNINDLYYALNADGTLGKVYGRLRFTSNASGTVTVTLPVPAIATDTQFVIANACTYARVWNGVIDIINGRDMTVNTNGNLVITFNSDGAGREFTVLLTPCLYFFTDFGDVVNPE